MHGGSITVASPGRNGGSTFTVTLPLGAPEVLAAERRLAVQFREALPKRGGGAGRRRVLIADDNADVADSLARLLESMHHEPHVVYSGNDAVHAYAELAPDVVFMDISMPDMDGFEAIEKIRKSAGGERALICTLSGHGKQHAARAFTAGADGHLVKPVGRAELAAVLERA
jgi:CheY-like chemotaxis protein